MKKQRSERTWIWQEEWPRLAALFFIYAVLGWCMEGLFDCFVKHEGFVNNGFLFGPACPIYAFSMLSLVWLLRTYIRPTAETGKPWYVRIGMVFLLSVIITTLLELVVGYVLFTYFNQVRLWDYTAEAGNVGGYICPRFSVIWGVACVVALLVVHPFFERLVRRVPLRTLRRVDLGLGAIIAVDFVLSVAKLLKLW